MVRARLHLLLWLTACAGEPTDGGESPSDIAIERFTVTTATVQPCSRVGLSWSVSGAEIVSITMDGVTLISTFAAEGMVESRPICERATFTITAEDGDAEVSSSLALAPEWSTPVIESFGVFPERGIVGQDLSVTFRVAGAKELRVEMNGEVVRRIELTPEEVRATGFEDGVLVKVQSSTNTLVLSALNPDHMVSSEVTVYADLLQIDQFIVHPPAAYGLTRATIHWRARAEVIRLLNGGIDVAEFPGTERGSLELDVAPPTYLTLLAMTHDQQASVSSSFEPPLSEYEPNDFLYNASDLYNLAAAGTLAAGDVDSYFIHFERPTAISIYTLNRSSDGCAVDSTISFFDGDGAELGRRHGGGPASAMGECVLAVPEEQAFLRDLNGLYFLSIFSELGETGDYLMIVAIQPN